MLIGAWLHGLWQGYVTRYIESKYMRPRDARGPWFVDPKLLAAHSETMTPLLVFVNVKSGGATGDMLMDHLRAIDFPCGLNEVQVSATAAKTEERAVCSNPCSNPRPHPWVPPRPWGEVHRGAGVPRGVWPADRQVLIEDGPPRPLRRSLASLRIPRKRGHLTSRSG